MHRCRTVHVDRIAERDREGGDRLRGAELAGGVQVGRKGGGGRAGREGDEPRFEDALEEGHDRYACRAAANKPIFNVFFTNGIGFSRVVRNIPTG